MNTSRQLEVEMISAPQNPLGTLFYVWEQSRSNNAVPSPEWIEQLLEDTDETAYFDGKYGKALIALGAVRSPGSPVLVQPTRERVWATIQQIMDEDIPCTENLNFVFALRNMPISLREQLVRHRIGVQVGQNVGVDIVPDLAESSWWSQTMRMLPMGAFYSEGRYIVPDSLEGKNVETEGGVTGISDNPYTVGKFDYWHENVSARELYEDLMEQIEFVYNKLVEAGVPMEDARQIIPIGATHGLTWSLNLKAMMHILGKRACWVAQANLWADLISQMVEEMCQKVHPIFRKIILPPCFKKGKYNTCPYFQINRERVQGRDHMPPCPMWVYHETDSALDAERESFRETSMMASWQPPVVTSSAALAGVETRDIRNWVTYETVEKQMLVDNMTRFAKLWKLDVLTGDAL